MGGLCQSQYPPVPPVLVFLRLTPLGKTCARSYELSPQASFSTLIPVSGQIMESWIPCILPLYTLLIYHLPVPAFLPFANSIRGFQQ